MTEEAYKEIIRQLRSDLDHERRNAPFYDEISKNFEDALGPHPRLEGGCWITRAIELRVERDDLRQQVKDLTVQNNLMWDDISPRLKNLLTKKK